MKKKYMKKRTKKAVFCSCEFPFPGSKGIVRFSADSMVGGQLCSTCGYLRWILTDSTDSKIQEFEIKLPKGAFSALAPEG
jgi:hypothetical protein